MPIMNEKSQNLMKFHGLIIKTEIGIGIEIGIESKQINRFSIMFIISLRLSIMNTRKIHANCSTNSNEYESYSCKFKQQKKTISQENF